MQRALYRKDTKKSVNILLQQYCKIKEGQVEVGRRSGRRIVLDISEAACDKFGFYFLDRIVCPTGNASVLGVATCPEEPTTKVMWVQVHGEQGVSYWDNGVDYDALVNDLHWNKLTEHTIPNEVIANLCSFVKNVDFNPIINWDYIVVDAQQIDTKKRDELINTFFKCKKCGIVKIKEPHKCKFNTYNPTQISIYNYPPPQSTTVTPSMEEEKRKSCPMCNKLFPVSMLEIHAASCYAEKEEELDNSVVTVNFADKKLRTQHKHDDNNTLFNRKGVLTLKDICVKSLLNAVNNDRIQTDGILQLYEFASDNPEFLVLKAGCARALVKNFASVIQLPAFKGLSKNHREHLFIEYVRTQSSLPRKTLLDFVEMALTEGMDEFRAIIAPQLISVKTVVSVFKSIATEPDYERTKSYCIEFISECTLTDITGTADFNSMEQWMQNMLLVDQHARFQQKQQEKMQQQKLQIEDIYEVPYDSDIERDNPEDFSDSEEGSDVPYDSEMERDVEENTEDGERAEEVNTENDVLCV